MAKIRRGLMSKEVISIRYKHAYNGKFYEHEFGPGVKMFAVPAGEHLQAGHQNGTIVLYKKGFNLFDEYPDEE